MEPVLAIPIGLLAVIVLYAWHRFYYDYQITPNALKVTWLGFRVRRLKLSDIESISKRRKFRAENWANTWRPRHRILVLRRRSGLRKDFIITPVYRYEFRNQLETAMAKLDNSP